jgi:hypothetical protein
MELHCDVESVGILLWMRRNHIAMSEVSKAVPRSIFDDVYNAAIIIYDSGDREQRFKQCVSIS